LGALHFGFLFLQVGAGISSQILNILLGALDGVRFILGKSAIVKEPEQLHA
jgi:hypothetical protein